MPSYRDEAIVLRTYRLGEADRIIVLLSAEHGKIRAVAKGVRRTSSKLGGRVEPFSHVDVQLYQGKTLDTITQAETLHSYDAPLRNNYPAFTAGQAILEAVDKLVDDYQIARGQFRLLNGALYALAYGTPAGKLPPTLILDSYLLRALSVAGYAPQLANCTQCGAQPSPAWFSAEAGGLVCAGCRPPGSVLPSEAAWQLLCALLTGDWPATKAFDKTTAHEVSGLVARYVQWQLGTKLRSLSLVDRD